MDISGRIRELRKKRGLNQFELADDVGVSVDSVRRWESNKQFPRADELANLATVLGVTVDELLNSSASQEFEVKIVMGVKSMTGFTGVEVVDNSFVFGVDDNKPQIVLAGKINVATPEDRKNALEEIIKKFHAACWMLDHKQDAEKGE